MGKSEPREEMSAVGICCVTAEDAAEVLTERPEQPGPDDRERKQGPCEYCGRTGAAAASARAAPTATLSAAVPTPPFSSRNASTPSLAARAIHIPG